jgi:KH-domain-like of EngA bacterial GTPase enzymes, C-terminal
VADQPGLLKQLREDCTRLLPQVRGVAVVPLSGLAGDGIDKLMQAVVQASEVWDRRISTSRINDWLNEATSRNPPPAVSGRRIKIRYATQVKSRPPHFALFGNQLNALPKSYTRYLVNGLREAFDRRPGRRRETAIDPSAKRGPSHLRLGARDRARSDETAAFATRGTMRIRVPNLSALTICKPQLLSPRIFKA